LIRAVFAFYIITFCVSFAPVLTCRGTVDVCNYSIIEGILAVDANTLEITNAPPRDIAQALFNADCSAVPDYDDNGGCTADDQMGTDEPSTPSRNGAHGCSVQELSLLIMCQNNYNAVQNYYNDMVYMIKFGSTLDPGMAAASFWIAKVMPGGIWDYKVQPGFAPYNTLFCAYFNGTFNHITSEYIGNFNFGYTGKFLFTLSTLHFGSSAVSGFSASDPSD